MESIRRWWNGAGRNAYPDAGRLLITADAGGSNGYRHRAWKAELAAFAVETGLTDHRLPHAAGHIEVEQDRTPAVLGDHHELARPALTSHEVVVNSIAATTTGTGLRVVAELDTNTYDTGTKVSDRQMDALPVTRHDWHGDWNYTIRPEHFPQLPTGPDPLDQMSPDLAWLCRPALTGMPAADWHYLIETLLGLHEQQRETALDKRRGHRPRLVNTGLGTGRRPMLTLADRLMAVILHQHHGLPQVAIAALFGVRPETLNRRIRDTRELLKTAGRTITPTGHRLASRRTSTPSSSRTTPRPSRRSNKRVDYRRALNYAALDRSAGIKPDTRCCGGVAFGLTPADRPDWLRPPTRRGTRDTTSVLCGKAPACYTVVGFCCPGPVVGLVRGVAG